MRVLILAGKESPEDVQKCLLRRFEHPAQAFNYQLVTQLGIPDEAISRIFFGYPAGWNTAEAVKKSIEEFILENPEETLCVAYIGHGQEDGWALSGVRDENSLTYEDLNLIFALHGGNLIFVNDCCYGGAGVRALESHSGDSLLLAPLPATHAGYAWSFLNTLINDWGNGRRFNLETSGDNGDIKPVAIGKEDLQDLFFPKRKRISEPEAQNER